MAFNLMAAIGAAGKRGSEILKEEREEALANSTEALKIFTTLGLPKAAEYKQNARLKGTMFENLSNEGFDGDRIAVIMKEGKGQKILDYIDEKKSVIKNYKIDPNEVVKFAGDYKKHGYTQQEVIELVIGKVERGIPVADAMQQVTGKNTGGTFTEAIGGNLGRVGKQRMENVANAAGVSIDELAAYASDSLTFDPIKVKGTVSLFDETKAAKASGNVFTTDKAKNRLASFGSSRIIGGKNVGSTADGQAVYALDAGIAKSMLDDKVSELVTAAQAKKPGIPLTGEDIRELELEIDNWARNTEYEPGKYLHASSKPDALEQAGKNDNGSIGGPLDVSGKTVNQLQDMLRAELTEIQGKKPSDTQAEILQKQIEAAIIQQLAEEGITNKKTARARAKNIVKSIMKNAGYNKSSNNDTIELVTEK
tara:strand:+ start:965 stop:2233 length:1269 start_codon:yes stop_codon:yes gene_type:complete